MSWARLESNFLHHPKTYALCERLADADADRYLPRIWAWASAMCEAGRLPMTIAAPQIEAAARWSGPRGGLFSALVACGWVDVRSGEAVLHDWDATNGGHIREARRDRERKRRETLNSGGPSGGGSGGVSRQSSACTDGRTDVANGRTPDTTSSRVSETPTAEVLSLPLPALRVAAAAAPAGKKAPKGKGKETNPRHAPLLAALVEVFQQQRGGSYGFDGGKDATALSRLLRMERDDAEILARWKRALNARFPACNNLAQLAQHWNAYLASGAARRGKDSIATNAGTTPEDWNGFESLNGASK